MGLADLASAAPDWGRTGPGRAVPQCDLDPPRDPVAPRIIGRSGRIQEATRDAPLWRGVRRILSSHAKRAVLPESLCLRGLLFGRDRRTLRPLDLTRNERPDGHARASYRHSRLFLLPHV